VLGWVRLGRAVSSTLSSILPICGRPVIASTSRVSEPSIVLCRNAFMHHIQASCSSGGGVGQLTSEFQSPRMFVRLHETSPTTLITPKDEIIQPSIHANSNSKLAA